MVPIFDPQPCFVSPSSPRGEVDINVLLPLLNGFKAPPDRRIAVARQTHRIEVLGEFE